MMDSGEMVVWLSIVMFDGPPLYHTVVTLAGVSTCGRS